MTVLNYIEDSVDIHVLPVVHDILCGRPGDEIVIGDLHANTIKFIYFFIRHGALSGMTAEEYAELVRICTTTAEDLTKNDLIIFVTILKRQQYNKNIIVNAVGDELGDRVDSSDVFMLLFIQIVLAHGVSLKIHLSNHSSQMIEACELKTGFESAMLLASDRLSMLGVHTMIKNELITQDEVLVLYNDAYKKTLRVNSRFFDTHLDGRPSVYIISHAGIDIKTVRGQTDYLMNKSLPGRSRALFRELNETMDANDKTFRAVVEGNLINQLYDTVTVSKAYQGPCDLRNRPFEETMWNRQTEQLDRSEEQEDFHMYYIHGHHLNDANQSNVCNLDNTLGKSRDNHIGQYTMVYKTDHPVRADFIDEYEFSHGRKLFAVKEARKQYTERLFAEFDRLDSGEISTTTSSNQSRRSARTRLNSTGSEAERFLNPSDRAEPQNQQQMRLRERFFSIDSTPGDESVGCTLQPARRLRGRLRSIDSSATDASPHGDACAQGVHRFSLGEA